MTRVIIIGRDAPLWLAALALHRALAPARVDVAVVELPTALAPAEAYATLPAIEALHARLGIDEATLLRATGTALTLGTNFVGPPAPPFLLPWGSHGAPVDGTPFFPAWLRARAQELDARLQDFSLTAVAASNGRLMLADEHTAAFARTDYAYTLPARAYVGFLKGLATRAGIEARQTHDVAAERVDGDIVAIVLDAGERLAGDLFVDASGSAAVLAGVDDAIERWDERFPTTTRLVARAPVLRSIPPYLEQRAMPEGWIRLHPTPAGTFVVAAGGDEHADTLLAAAQAATGLPLGDAYGSRIVPQRRVAVWRGNCVAIGGAAGTLDPVFGLDLHVAQLGIVHLLALFPAGPDAQAERHEYNRLLASHLDRVADAQLALYALAPWPGTFWERARSTLPGAALAHRIATFIARGQVAPLEDDSFDDTWWEGLFVGLGTIPESWPPTADRLAPDAIKAAFRGMFGFIRETVLAQPSHDAYLADLARGAVR